MGPPLQFYYYSGMWNGSFGSYWWNAVFKKFYHFQCFAFAYVGSLYLTELLPLQQLGTTFAQALNGVTKTKEILELPVYESDGIFLHIDIAVKNISFSYDGKKNVLENCVCM